MVGLIALVSLTGVAQEPNPRVLYERARLIEDARQIKEAARLYTEVVARAKGDKALMAAAAARLAALTPSKTVQNEMPRRVMASTSVTPSSVSADGRNVAGMQGRNVVLCDLVDGSTRTLVSAADDEQFTAGPQISPDGRWVAYGFVGQAAPLRPVGLRVIGTIGSATVRTIWSQVGGQSILPVAWSPDARQILTRRGTGVAPGVSRPPGAPIQLAGFESSWVSVATGEFHPMKSFESWQNPQGMTVSPDGQWVAYSDVPVSDPRGTNIYIYVTPARGGMTQAVVKMAGRNLAPVWTADGSHLLFSSDRSGQALWTVEVQAGAAIGDPLLVQSGFNDRIIGRSTADVLYIARTQPGVVTTFVGERSGSDLRVRYSFPGSNASIAPDGRSVAFFTSNNPGSTQLTVRTLESGEERRYAGRELFSPGQALPAPEWFPRGDALLAYVPAPGDDNRPGGSLYRVDVASGTFTRSFARNPEHARLLTGRLSPDGATYYTLARPGASGKWTSVVAVDIGTGAERQIVTFPDGLEATLGAGLAVSPDGQFLAIEALLVTNNLRRARLFVVGLVDQSYREVSEVAYAGYLPLLPAWSADGQTILIGQEASTMESRSGVDSATWRIVAIPASGVSESSVLIDLARLERQVALPEIRPSSGGGVTVSRDGSRLTFNAVTVSTNELWAVNSAALLARKQ